MIAAIENVARKMTMQRIGNTYVYDIWVPRDQKYKKQEEMSKRTLEAVDDEESDEESEADFSRQGDDLL